MEDSKTCIVTGASGQDGVYLSRLLSDKGCRVIGLTRGTTSDRDSGFARLGVEGDIQLINRDLMDISQIITILTRYEHRTRSTTSRCRVRFPCPSLNPSARSSAIRCRYSTCSNRSGSSTRASRCIRRVAARCSARSSGCRSARATPSIPSPYAVSKASAHWACVNYRDSYGMFMVCGFLFNHESPLRNEGFFVKKAVNSYLRMQTGALDHLEVGNIDIMRVVGDSA